MEEPFLVFQRRVQMRLRLKFVLFLSGNKSCGLLLVKRSVLPVPRAQGGTFLPGRSQPDTLSQEPLPSFPSCPKGRPAPAWLTPVQGVTSFIPPGLPFTVGWGWIAASSRRIRRDVLVESPGEGGLFASYQPRLREAGSATLCPSRCFPTRIP